MRYFSSVDSGRAESLAPLGAARSATADRRRHRRRRRATILSSATPKSGHFSRAKMREQAGKRSYRSPDATGATAIRWQYRTAIQGGIISGKY